MKKKAIKIAASTAVAASAFVAAAPVNKADAAVNVDQLVKSAEASAKVLQWSISTEGTANFVDRPYAQYNAAKKTNAAAKAAIAKLSASEKVVYEARLLDSDIQIKRAQAYIDALTSGEKIRDKQAALDKAIKAADLKSVQSSYHVLTAEIRKQAELLYRVYGQSTRDGILKTFKAPAESLYRSVINEVTVLDHTALVDKYTKAKDFDKAVDHVEKAEYALKDVKQFKAELTKNLNDVVDALPLTVKSINRINSTTVEVKFTKALDVAPVTHFTFDKGLEVSSTKLSDDKKTVTLTVNGEKAGETYTLSYKGEATKSFTAPKTSTNDPITSADKAERIEENQYRTYTFDLKDSDGRKYNGYADVELTTPDIVEIVSVNGDTKTTGVKVKDGVLSVVVKGAKHGETAVKVTNLDTGKTLTSGKTIVVFDQNNTLDKDSVLYVHPDKDYFTAKVGGVNDEFKFSFTKNDTFQVEGKIVSYEDFKKALTAHSKISVVYTKGERNFFNLVEKVDVKVITVTNPSKKDVRVNPKTNQKYFDLRGTGEAGKYVKINVDANGVSQYEVKVDSSGRWEERVYLTENAKNTFTIGQYEGKNSSDVVVGGTKEINIIEGAFGVTDVAGTFATGEELTLTFTTIDNYKDEAKFSSNSVLTFIDENGEKLEYQIGKDKTEVTSGDGTNVVKVKLGTPIKANSNFSKDANRVVKLSNISGVTNQDGLNLTVDFIPVK
ncbi:hypothetical protein LIS82_24955 [Cytobacillus solani]|uniref:SbsC C-terminal domain-containing protein n=1 Tax=Cytobacillus solani TaxID=1637975 RepID=A0A0Q3VJL5_9BACI|nr:hypothetical protein [Cytobacillus solani]KQL21447.1 hypothetical protein AN957_24780 [Cytobacillus solani]USK54750.1 hypothetical protein LIS82_24955 [Cytobacillus solani]